MNVNRPRIFVIMIKAVNLYYADNFYHKKHVYRQKDVNGVKHYNNVQSPVFKQSIKIDAMLGQMNVILIL